MSGDLVTLRMVVISTVRPVLELWRQAAGLASVPIEFADADPLQARPLLSKGGLDIVVLDGALPENDRAGLIKTARGKAPAPFIALLAAGSPAGADAALGRPETSDETRALVERCIRARLPKRILIVDDSKTMRSIVRKILTASRYALDVFEAEEGMTALKTLGGGGADLVLLDYNMPGFNGLETLAEIKRVAPQVAVVMMTSTVDDAIAARAREAGAVAFLKKPFYPADIDAVFDRLYGAPAN